MKLFIDLENPGKLIVEDLTVADCIEYQRPVQVYYNLHKHTFSIRDKQTRRVIGHSRSLALKDCTLKVSQAGRQRVLRERKKNVHATIEGVLVAGTVHDVEGATRNLTELTYNPYRYDSFVIKDNETPVSKAGWVVFNTKRIWGEGLTPR
jgi:hypothetical protein